MNLIEKYGKKKISIIAGCAITFIIIIGAGLWYVNEQHHKEEVLATIKVQKQRRYIIQKSEITPYEIKKILI